MREGDAGALTNIGKYEALSFDRSRAPERVTHSCVAAAGAVHVQLDGADDARRQVCFHRLLTPLTLWLTRFGLQGVRTRTVDGRPDGADDRQRRAARALLHPRGAPAPAQVSLSFTAVVANGALMQSVRVSGALRCAVRCESRKRRRSDRGARRRTFRLDDRLAAIPSPTRSRRSGIAQVLSRLSTRTI